MGRLICQIVSIPQLVPREQRFHIPIFTSFMNKYFLFPDDQLSVFFPIVLSRFELKGRSLGRRGGGRGNTFMRCYSRETFRKELLVITELANK